MSQSITTEDSVVIPKKKKKVIDKIVQDSVDEALSKSVNNYTDKPSIPESVSTEKSGTVTPIKKNQPVKSSGLTDDGTQSLKDVLEKKSSQNKSEGRDEKTQDTIEKNKIFTKKAVNKVLPNVVGKTVDFLLDSPNAAKFQQSKNFQQNSLNSVATPATDAAALSLPGLTSEAQKGVMSAADTTNRLGTPVAKAASEAALDNLEFSKQQLRGTKLEYKRSLTAMHNATRDAGAAMEMAVKKSEIDPDLYLKKLGVSGRLLSSIGIILSGAGAGLSGQPNMAMQVFQKNIDRDIAAQQQNYQNLMENAVKQRDLLLTAKDRKLIATAAYYGAQQSVLMGAQAAIENVGALTKFATAKDVGKTVISELQQRLLKSMQDYTSLYKTVSSSGDLNNYNTMGVGIAAVADHLLGTNLSMDTRDPSQRFSLRSPNAVGTVDPKPDVESSFQEEAEVKSPFKSNDFLNSYRSLYHTR